MIFSKIKINADTVNVTFKRNDEEIKCLMSIEDYFEYKLKKDEYIYDLTLQELKKKEVILNAWNLCIRKISLKDRTRKEIYDILLKDNTLEISQINNLIEKLEEKGYINDRLYLKNYLGKMNDSIDGKQKFIRKLVKKGIPYEMIMNEMSSYNDSNEKEKAHKFLEKLEKTMHNGSVHMKKQYMISKLINRGFSFDIAKDAVFEYEFSEEFFQIDDALNKDIEKAVKVASRRYHGYERQRRVISQLVQKGYKKEDILEKLEEGEYFDED